MLPSVVAKEVISALIRRAKLSPNGSFVEVGVYKGGTAWHLSKLAEEQNRKIYLYDTFEGIPYKDKIDSHKVGDFNDTSYDKIVEAIPYAQVIKVYSSLVAASWGSQRHVHLEHKGIKQPCWNEVLEPVDPASATLEWYGPLGNRKDFPWNGR